MSKAKEDHGAGASLEPPLTLSRKVPSIRERSRPPTTLLAVDCPALTVSECTWASHRAEVRSDRLRSMASASCWPLTMKLAKTVRPGETPTLEPAV